MVPDKQSGWHGSIGQISKVLVSSGQKMERNGISMGIQAPMEWNF